MLDEGQAEFPNSRLIPIVRGTEWKHVWYWICIETIAASDTLFEVQSLNRLFWQSRNHHHFLHGHNLLHSINKKYCWFALLSTWLKFNLKIQNSEFSADFIFWMDTFTYHGWRAKWNHYKVAFKFKFVVIPGYFVLCCIFEFDIVEFMERQRVETGSIAHELLWGLISFKV